jgi:predicted O-methyltransferase YrrM
VVVETGVAYGITSAYILQALAENGEGELHSIDLPPLGPAAEKYVGYLIPHGLRKRWNLHIGPARKLLPEVLRKNGGADAFIHDSLHTYTHMTMEFAAALAALRPGGILIADDVQGNRAFEEAIGHLRVASWFAIKEQGKDAICGAMRLRDL